MGQGTHLVRRRHGGSGTSEYHAWKAMRRRCLSVNDAAYNEYGGRGITICRRWNDFDAFIEDMGLRPSPRHSLDRIDNSKGYTPSNCRWATKQEQSANRRPLPNQTGWTGVRSKPHGKFVAHIHQRGVYKYLGTFDTAKEAHNAYIMARQEIRA